mmetsp:Transcript_9552/g.13807  ORF Transcript_9552/g.13807 Transcript_9552/m.13807 type:complete len:81 (+) Transcript_9552:1185-1427(+)
MISEYILPSEEPSLSTTLPPHASVGSVDMDVPDSSHEVTLNITSFSCHAKGMTISFLSYLRASALQSAFSASALQALHIA